MLKLFFFLLFVAGVAAAAIFRADISSLADVVRLSADGSDAAKLLTAGCGARSVGDGWWSTNGTSNLREQETTDASFVYSDPHACGFKRFASASEVVQALVEHPRIVMIGDYRMRRLFNTLHALASTAAAVAGTEAVFASSEDAVIRKQKIKAEHSWTHCHQAGATGTGGTLEGVLHYLQAATAAEAAKIVRSNVTTAALAGTNGATIFLASPGLVPGMEAPGFFNASAVIEGAESLFDAVLDLCHRLLLAHRTQLHLQEQLEQQQQQKAIPSPGLRKKHFITRYHHHHRWTLRVFYLTAAASLSTDAPNAAVENLNRKLRWRAEARGFGVIDLYNSTVGPGGHGTRLPICDDDKGGLSGSAANGGRVPNGHLFCGPGREHLAQLALNALSFLRHPVCVA